MKILTCNIGSTSLKYQLFDMTNETVVAKGKIDGVGSEKAQFTFKNSNGQTVSKNIKVLNQLDSTKFALASLIEYGTVANTDDIAGIGFKTVHGGKISGAKLIDQPVMNALQQFITVSPLHNKVYYDVINSFIDVLPNVPKVAVFETAFHQSMPEYAKTYAVPYEWKEKYGIQKYGFHGASHRYISERIPELLNRSSHGLRIISCHLGGSSSVCAIKDGKSMDTSMGFSPQSGLAMGTRNGDLDVYTVFYLSSLGFKLEEINEQLFNKSGLVGLSGMSQDMKVLEEEAAKGNTRAQLAIDVYVYEIKKYIGAYWTILGGAEVLVFTGGIGETSSFIRNKVCAGLEHLGIALDMTKNLQNLPEEPVTTDNAKVKVYVVPTNEELIIARETLKVITSNK